MHGSVAILASPGSDLATKIEAGLRQREVSTRVLSLDAPVEGGAVSILPTAVVWQGFDLLGAGAVLVERPLFAWPQPQCIANLLDGGAPSPRLVGAEREARSLALSALEVASGVTRVINPPSAAHVAVSPAAGLHRLGRAGLAVHPWRVEPAPDDVAAGPSLVVDVVGRELRHDPARPSAGRPSLILDPVPDEVVSLCLVGDRTVGALRFPDGPSWLDRAPSATLNADEIDTELTETAARVAVELELEIVVVSIAGQSRPPRILFADAGPDLAEWNRALDGRLASALAQHLARIAAGREGVVA